MLECHKLVFNVVARYKVSHTNYLARYTERKQVSELDRKNPYHLSPLTNHKNIERGVVTGGFERKQYSERVEQAFDQAFAYERPLVETFRYAHTMQHSTPEECITLRLQAIREQVQVVEQTLEKHPVQPNIERLPVEKKRISRGHKL